MASEIPLCFGSEQHSDTSLICKRCSFEDACYKALKKNNEENKKRIDAAVAKNHEKDVTSCKLCNHSTTKQHKNNNNNKGVGKVAQVTPGYKSKIKEVLPEHPKYEAIN